MAKHLRKRLRVVADESDAAMLVAEPPTTGVGGVLRAERLRRGLQIDDVATSLRIRRALLTAIEENRFDDLPGRTYAIGFLRAYADHLELDSDEVVRQFREEVQGVDGPIELNFPAPPSQGRLPGAVVVALAGLLAIGGYGFWYYLTIEQRAGIERVAAVPPRLLPPTEERAPPPSPSQAEAATVPGLSVAARTSVDAMSITGVAPLEPPRLDAAAPARPVAAASAPAVATSDGDDDEASEAGARPAATTVLPVPVPRPPAQPPASESATARVFGDTANPVRITVHAVGDSWVQVRDSGSNEVVFMRIMRTGDSYNVPVRQGLTLSTGNAGLIEVRVDGRTVVPIGRMGFVRRDVALDPDRLVAGTAVPDQSRPAAANPGAAPPSAARPTDG